MTKSAFILVRADPTERELAWSLASLRGVRRVERVRGAYQFVVSATCHAVAEIEALPEVRDVEVCWLSGATGWCER